MHLRLLIAVATAAASQLSGATKLFTSARQLQTTEYDFIVIGGGTAGSVIANRISADPNVTILLIEAGGNEHDFFDARIPYLAPQLAGTAADWNYTTVPQTGYNDRTLNFTRGHALGGSSTINYMAYNRASNDTYDRWAEIVEDDAWSWKELEPYYRRNAHLVAPADGRDYSQDVIASAHGNGPVDVSVAAHPYPLDYRVINASKELDGRFAYNRDLNAGDFVGVSWAQAAITSNGERDSAATAYLDPLFEEPAGSRSLDVLLHTQVTRLVQSGQESGIPIFREVEMATSSNSTFCVTARKEIILSAGVVGTPQILLQSGIGPTAELSALTIPVVVDLPSVGKNLTDHPLYPMYFNVKQNTTTDPIMQNPAIMQQALAQWNATHDGPLANTASNTYAFIRLPENNTFISEGRDPAAGPLSSNTELLFGQGFAPVTDIPTPESGSYITVLTIVTSPTSRGSITLNTSDPLAHPVINPNYLTTEFDQQAMVQAMKDVFTLLANDAFDGYIGASYGPLANATTDAQLLANVKAHGATIWHGVGTAKMSARGADWGVLDPDLRVKGTKGLRVADAAVFPEIPECHTMVPVYIVAERAAGFVVDEYGLQC